MAEAFLNGADAGGCRSVLQIELLAEMVAYLDDARDALAVTHGGLGGVVSGCPKLPGSTSRDHRDADALGTISVVIHFFLEKGKEICRGLCRFAHVTHLQVVIERD
jgi:hypothetical protein